MSQDFAEFYSAHFREIAAQLYAYLGDYCEAQDITQEAFCRALDRWGRVRAYEHPLAWVRHVAWNLATSRLRHLQVAMRHLAGQRPEHVDGPGPDRVAVVQALAALPPNHRLAVVLHHIAELSTSEIAEQRGVAEGTVRSWLSRGRSQLAEQFAEFQPGFTPPGVDVAAATVKRRRAMRRTTLAAVVLISALALAATLLRFVGKPEVVSPTPVETRRAVLGVADLNVAPEILPADAAYHWLFYRECETGQVRRPARCRYALGATSDGGRSWRRITLPEMSPERYLYPYVVDSRTVVLQISADSEPIAGYFVSRDEGATFTWHPFTGNIVDAAEILELIGGRFQMLCRDGSPFGCGGARELFDVRTGQRVDAPAGTGNSGGVTQGKDGRMWLRATSFPGQRLFVSSDGGRSWSELGWPAGGRTFHLSPAGTQAWVSGGGSFWELEGASWVLRMAVDLPLANVDPVLIGDDGLWLVWRDAGYWYLKDGFLTKEERLENLGTGRLLADGTVAVVGPGGVHLGTGKGMDRQWVYLKL